MPAIRRRKKGLLPYYSELTHVPSPPPRSLRGHSLNPDTAALLPRLVSLQRLVLDGNQVDDAALAHVAALPRLRYVGQGGRVCVPGWAEGLALGRRAVMVSAHVIVPRVALPSPVPCCRDLSLRRSDLLTDVALRDMARRRGSTVLVRSSSGGGEGRGGGEGGEAHGSGGGGAHSSGDVGLVSLDISGCTRITDLCWVAITEVSRCCHTPAAAPAWASLWCLGTLPTCLPPADPRARVCISTCRCKASPRCAWSTCRTCCSSPR